MKIYLSSTFVDLEKYRERVYHALRTLRHDVIAMEEYVAADERPLERCLKDVAESDLYVGLFAWRYGYVPPRRNPDKRSITELEYREAKRLGKPCLLFLLDPGTPWPPGMMDSSTGDNDDGARIKRLRSRLEAERLVSRFESPDQLASRVLGAIGRWQIENAEATPAPAAPTPRRLDEAAAAAAQRPRARPGYPRLWLPGSRLRVRFVDGTPLLQQRVLRLAQIWTAYANLSFEESSAGDAEIRIAFEAGMGSWSYEGPMCLGVPAGERTMNLDWVHQDSDISDLESVVLHEFSHVLGLGHEHNNPEARLPWRKDVVYREMCGPPNHWAREDVDLNLFTVWPADRFPIRKPYDPLSITAFPIPAHWTSNGQEIGRNTAISALDREFVARLYPYGAPRAHRAPTASGGRSDRRNAKTPSAPKRATRG